MVGRRLVSEKEWLHLQSEVSLAESPDRVDGPVWVVLSPDRAWLSCVGGPVWVVLCVWSCVDGPVWVVLCEWSCVGGPAHPCPLSQVKRVADSVGRPCDLTVWVVLCGGPVPSHCGWSCPLSQVKRVADSVGRPCDLCDGLRARLEECRERERRLSGQVSTLERQLQAERVALAAQLRQLEEVEATLAEITAAETQHVSRQDRR